MNRYRLARCVLAVFIFTVDFVDLRLEGVTGTEKF
jgi:hypothetical protein